MYILSEMRFPRIDCVTILRILHVCVVIYCNFRVNVRLTPSRDYYRLIIVCLRISLEKREREPVDNNYLEKRTLQFLYKLDKNVPSHTPCNANLNV